ncbi:response regulator transcription factor [Paenibacillus hunanensis]|uniref:DNA-binding response OmpR family regulator n=1 Tax=Paenibacillus hunanensis TaxID=539262 RepID=A0ABU1IST4_9BACL|nr:response regulator transcription factor [Paenibacillus hunanensis]MDR6242312.1 DNA-binding response OmpR family regulator [Paenibacillus hunanensis]GGJ06884.1 DNA-binding response regulator [Paenibacillus hunanensis]
MHVLLAEDDTRLGELIVHMLQKKAGYTVDWVTTGNDAYAHVEYGSYDILILDWMMPEGDGLSLCTRLRKESYTGAILMLTARDALQDRIDGLDAGADDYLVKPFEIGELLARLRALSRRNYAPIQTEEMKFGELVLNRNEQCVSLDSRSVQLTPREFQLFDLLVQNRGVVLTREVILDRVWGMESDVGPKTIDATIKLLRRKLAELDNKELIQSARGLGYKVDK